MKKPEFHRRLILWAIDCWRVVMDNRYNPLRFIPDPSVQFYFTMVLFILWSVYFGFLATLYMGWFGYDILLSIIIHLCVLIPIGVTNAVFIDAERNGSRWHQNWRNEQQSWKFWTDRPSKSGKNIIKWDIDKEA
tara:strand:+ start:4249 stop:4650 length:402 start_codon:yes stop_codon:yes gene_type:complete